MIRGSASQGQEFAALQFTNTGPARCVLYGYPSVTLLRAGNAIGRPAQPSGDKASRRELTPGATAESQLHDYTNCSAALSDSLRVSVPGSSQSAVRPAELRACTLRVDALAAPA